MKEVKLKDTTDDVLVRFVFTVLGLWVLAMIVIEIIGPKGSSAPLLVFGGAAIMVAAIPMIVIVSCIHKALKKG